MRHPPGIREAVLARYLRGRESGESVKAIAAALEVKEGFIRGVIRRFRAKQREKNERGVFG